MKIPRGGAWARLTAAKPGCEASGPGLPLSLWRRRSFWLAQAHVEANDWAPDIDSKILILWLRQVGIGDVHVRCSGGQAKPGNERPRRKQRGIPKNPS